MVPSLPPGRPYYDQQKGTRPLISLWSAILTACIAAAHTCDARKQSERRSSASISPKEARSVAFRRSCGWSYKAARESEGRRRLRGRGEDVSPRVQAKVN